MENLTNYLVRNKDTLNLSEISRLAGYSPQYLKHVVAGRRNLTSGAEKAVRIVLDDITTTKESE